MSVLTVFPDANPETTSVDGYAQQQTDPSTWATLQGGAGNGASDTVTSDSLCVMASATSNRWRVIKRLIFLFDTSALTGNANIGKAILSLDAINGGVIDDFTDSVSITTSNPASNTALANGDFDSLGAVKQAPDKLLSSIVYLEYNDWVLNSTGIGNISKTGVTKFGARATSDNDNSEPTWASGNARTEATFYFADNTGTDRDPKLTILYETSGDEILVVYPDAGSGNTTVDGYMRHVQANMTWAQIRAAAGTEANSTAEFMYMTYMQPYSTTRWNRLGRGGFTFDTSSLGAGATINSATLSTFHYAAAINNVFNISANIYSFVPANNNALVAGDFDSLGTTAFSTTKHSGDITHPAYNDWVLNSSGRSAISKTGITRLGSRDTDYDASGSTPPISGWTSGAAQIYIRASDYVGTSEDPVLTIGYTTGTTHTKILPESFSIGEDFSILKTKNKEFEESMSIGEDLAHTKTTSKTFFEHFSIGEDITARIINVITMTFTESFSIGESLIKKINGKVIDIWRRINKSITTWTKNPKDMD